ALTRTRSKGSWRTSYERGRWGDEPLSANSRARRDGKETRTESRPFQSGGARESVSSASCSIASEPAFGLLSDTGSVGDPVSRQARNLCSRPAPGLAIVAGLRSL